MKNHQKLLQDLVNNAYYFAGLYQHAQQVAHEIKTVEDAVNVLPEAHRPNEIVPVTIGEELATEMLGTSVTIGQKDSLSLLIWEREGRRVGTLVHNEPSFGSGYGFSPWGGSLGRIEVEKVGAIPPVRLPVFPFYHADFCELCQRGIPHVPVPELLRETVSNEDACKLTRAQYMQGLRKEHRLTMIVLGDGSQYVNFPKQRGHAWFFQEPKDVEKGRGSFLGANDALSGGWWSCHCGCGNYGRVPLELSALATHSSVR